MEAQQWFGHEHPLAFNEVPISNQSEQTHCFRCDEVMCGPSFSCTMEGCGFYLHKRCAEAPSQIDHPFHSKHPLLLLPEPRYKGGAYICDFCGGHGEKYVYNCSCNIDLHIKCALYTYNFAKKSFGELYHIPHIDPLISSGQYNNEEELERADCGINLQKICAQLPFEMDFLIHRKHRKHPLTLQFGGKWFSCKVCLKSQPEGFVYCCSPCNFGLHIDCVSPPPSLKDKCHDQHPFTLCLKQVSFICNICGKEGESIPYICCTCGFIVHKNCISLPQAIKMTLHHHIITRTYLLRQHESKNLDCQVCFDEVDTEYGSYCCSKCDFIVHVNCALELEDWYREVDLEDKDEVDRLALLYDMSMESIEVFEWNEAGEATIIRHFKHAHDLVLSNKVMDDVKCCDGCMLLITSPFFHCLQCDFLLHKFCAELPRKKTIWYEKCQHPFILTSLGIFRCKRCRLESSGFAYGCSECERYICLRCAIPFTLKHEGHEHPLVYVHKYKDGKCNACETYIYDGYTFKCKSCDFVLCFSCLILPQTVRDKCDKHVLKLTYHDDNDYSETHFCDICEEERDSKYWFYHCEICDTSVHIVCIRDRYQFIKVGFTLETRFHRHPLTFVRNVYYYPACTKCDRPCQRMALECLESGCNYINCMDRYCLQYKD